MKTKDQSPQWKWKKNKHWKKPNKKVLLTVFFDFKREIHHTRRSYVQQRILTYMPFEWSNTKNTICSKRLHDNAPAHTSLLVRDLLAQNQCLFPKLKRHMKGWRFAIITKLKTGLLKMLELSPKNTYQNCFIGYKKCILSGGSYL